MAQDNYSPRTRVIADEPALDRFRELARERYDAPEPRVIMLIPARLEGRIRRTLARKLRPQGLELAAVTALDGVYRLHGRRLVLHLTRAYAPEGARTIAVQVAI